VINLTRLQFSPARRESLSGRTGPWQRRGLRPGRRESRTRRRRQILALDSRPSWRRSRRQGRAVPVEEGASVQRRYDKRGHGRSGCGWEENERSRVTKWPSLANSRLIEISRETIESAIQLRNNPRRRPSLDQWLPSDWG